MRKDSTWGGNLELYAASRLLQVTIVIHQVRPPPAVCRMWRANTVCGATLDYATPQLDTPRFEMQNPDAGPRVVHLSYYGGEHYDSVRKLVRCARPDARRGADGCTG